MKRIILILLICTLNSILVFGQYRQDIKTDSSDIEIIRNSEYHIYEETFHDKDSVWYSIHYIKDTTRLNMEGWKTKSMEYLGVWKVYNYDGKLMYTRDYENNTCIVNEELYPYHDLLKGIKEKADSLIIRTFSQEFFDNHVRFDFDCSAYHGYWETTRDRSETYWSQDYIGSWMEPMKSKPNSFIFRYSIKFGESEWYPEMIAIELDSNGNFVPSEDYSSNYGFEDVKSQKKTFQISKKKAMKLAEQKGLTTTGTNKITAFLDWEKFNKAQFFDGQFRYYIKELTNEIKDTIAAGRSREIYKYTIYTFNPWTGEFIEKKKMKNVINFDEHCGYGTGLIPDDD
ncbi:MAG: hypothetical protein CVV25_03075 [Ignavibacteriae bacterium HGW-Ignavibacteriae-4]|nr:MAG: hypothetical protein CVV25_03075 [Ignavibacteriae bacterium HGW-Ignavibacteriae-4]